MRKMVIKLFNILVTTTPLIRVLRCLTQLGSVHNVSAVAKCQEDCTGTRRRFMCSIQHKIAAQVSVVTPLVITRHFNLHFSCEPHCSIKINIAELLLRKQ